MAKRDLKPLVPETDLQAFVRAAIAVPKAEVDEAEAKRVKRPRAKPEKKPQ